MSYGCSTCPDAPGLGLAPIIATALASKTTSLATSFFGGIFGNPKDKERAETAEALYNAALGGDTDAELRLRCLAGIPTPEVAAFDASVFADGSNCGFATKTARDFAMDLVQRLDGTPASGPGGYQGTPFLAAGVPGGSTMFWLLGGGLAVAWLVSRKKTRR